MQDVKEWRFSPVQPVEQLQATSLYMADAFSPSLSSLKTHSPWPVQLHMLMTMLADGATPPFTSVAANLYKDNDASSL